MQIGSVTMLLSNVTYHNWDTKHQQAPPTNLINQSHTDKNEECVCSCRNETSKSRVGQTEKAEECTSVVKKSVETGKLPSHLYKSNSNDGTTVRAFGNKCFCSLPVSGTRLKSSGSRNVFLSDADLVMDHLGSGFGVYSAEDMSSTVCLATENKDSGRLGEVVEEDKLKKGWSNTKSD